MDATREDDVDGVTLTRKMHLDLLSLQVPSARSSDVSALPGVAEPFPLEAGKLIMKAAQLSDTVLAKLSRTLGLLILSLMLAFLGAFCITIHFLSFPEKSMSESF